MAYEFAIEIDVARTSYAVPSGTLGCWVTLLGGGGAGGRGHASGGTNRGGGGGGGGGARVPRIWVPAASLGSTYSVTIGAAGATGSIGGSAQTAGGDSIFSTGSVTITAGGGAAGGNGTSTTLGAGGAGGTCSYSGISGSGYSGSAGGQGGNYSITNSGGSPGGDNANGAGAGGGGGGGLNSGGSNWANSWGDKGGDSGTSLGGARRPANVNQAGNPGGSSYNDTGCGGGSGGALGNSYVANVGGTGGTYGGGGGGSSATNSTQKLGGAGGAGRVRVEWKMPVSGDITREYVASGDSNPNTGFSLSWDHVTDGGADCVMLIAVSINVGTTGTTRNTVVPTVTYGSTTAEHLVSTDVALDSSGMTSFFIVRDPAPGNDTVAVSFSTSGGTPTVSFGASVSYAGVGGIRGFWNKSAAATTSPSITVDSDTGRKLVHAASSQGTYSSYAQTLLYQVTNDSRTMVLGDADGGSSVSFGITTSSAGNGHVAVELFPDTEANIVDLVSASLGGRATGSSTTLGVSYNHYVESADGNTLAVVHVGMSHSSATTSVAVTFGGTSMTQFGSVNYGAGNQSSIASFYLFNPPTGNSTVAVTTSGSATKYAVASGSVVYGHVSNGVRTVAVSSINADVDVLPIPGTRDRVMSVHTGSLAAGFDIDQATTVTYRNASSVSGLGDGHIALATMGTGSSMTMTATEPGTNTDISYVIVLSAAQLIYDVDMSPDLQRLVFSGTGGHSQNGTIAAAVRRALFGGSGTHAQSGTVAASFQRAAVAATGSHIYTGTATATMWRATMSASGGQGQTGTLAATARPAVAALAGGQTFDGAIAASMQKPTMAASGGQSFIGSLAAAFQKATFAGTGVQSYIGTVAAAFQRATFAGTGVQHPRGTMAAAMTQAVMAATGGQTYLGGLAAAFQRAVMAASGVQAHIGTVAATMTRAVMAAAGVQHPKGTMAATLSRATMFAAGGQGTVAAITATARPATMAASGAHSQSGTMAAVLRRALAALAAATGLSNVTGTMGVTMRRATFAGTPALLVIGPMAAGMRPVTILVLADTDSVTPTAADILFASLRPPTNQVISPAQHVVIHTYDGIQLYQFTADRQTSLSWSRVLRDVSTLDFTAPVEYGSDYLPELSPWLHWASVWDEDGQELYWTGPIQRVTRTRSSLSVSARDVSVFAKRTRCPITKRWESSNTARVAEELWDAMLDDKGLDIRPLVLRDPRGSTFDFNCAVDVEMLDQTLNRLVDLGLYWSVVAGKPILGPAPLASLTALGEAHFMSEDISVVRDGTQTYNDVVLRAANTLSRARTNLSGLSLQAIVNVDSVFGVSNADKAAQEFVRQSGGIRDSIEMPQGAKLRPDAPIGIQDLVPSVRLNVEAFGLLRAMEVERVAVSNGEVSVTLESVDDDPVELTVGQL